MSHWALSLSVYLSLSLLRMYVCVYGVCMVYLCMPFLAVSFAFLPFFSLFLDTLRFFPDSDKFYKHYGVSWMYSECSMLPLPNAFDASSVPFDPPEMSLAYPIPNDCLVEDDEDDNWMVKRVLIALNLHFAHAILLYYRPLEGIQVYAIHPVTSEVFTRSLMPCDPVITGTIVGKKATRPLHQVN